MVESIQADVANPLLHISFQKHHALRNFLMAAHQHMKRNKEDELDKIGLTRADLFTDIISTSAWIK